MPENLKINPPRFQVGDIVQLKEFDVQELKRFLMLARNGKHRAAEATRLIKFIQSADEAMVVAVESYNLSMAMTCHQHYAYRRPGTADPAGFDFYYGVMFRNGDQIFTLHPFFGWHELEKKGK